MKDEQLLRAIYEELGGVKQQIQDVAEEGRQERGKIIDQTTRTNGRVTIIEKWINDYQIRKDERERLEKRGISSDIHDNTQINIKARSQWFEDTFVRKLITALTAMVTAIGVYLGVR